MNDTQTHAFPSDPAGYQPQQGLTKREEFAKAAMQAVIFANAKTNLVELMESMIRSGGREMIANAVAEAAIGYADALLAKLNEQSK